MANLLLEERLEAIVQQIFDMTDIDSINDYDDLINTVEHIHELIKSNFPQIKKSE